TLRFLRHQVNVELAEGGYARILVEGGVLGLALFVLFLIDSVRCAWRDSTGYRELGFALTGMLILSHLSLYMLQITVVAVPWWLLYGAYRGAVFRCTQASARA